MQARKNSKIVILVDFHSEFEIRKGPELSISCSRHVNFILCKHILVAKQDSFQYLIIN